MSSTLELGGHTMVPADLPVSWVQLEYGPSADWALTLRQVVVSAYPGQPHPSVWAPVRCAASYIGSHPSRREFACQAYHLRDIMIMIRTLD